jgi:hypothetical protein
MKPRSSSGAQLGVRRLRLRCGAPAGGLVGSIGRVGTALRSLAAAASAASAPQASPWTQSTQQAEVADQTQAQQQPGSDATAPEGDPSAAQQFGDGAKQIAAGAARGFQNAVDSQAKETGPARLLGWLPLLLAALALLGIGAMFFPSARIGIDLGRDDLPITFPTGSASFYGSSQGHIGIYLVILLAATIVLAVLAFATHKLWARIGAAVVGLASGIVGLVAGFGAASGDKRDFTDAIRNHLESALPGLFKKYSDYFGGMDSEDVPDQIQDFFDDSSAWGMVDIKLGFGAVILGILAILIVIVSVAVAVPPRQVNALAARSAAANQPANGGQTAWGQPRPAVDPDAAGERRSVAHSAVGVAHAVPGLAHSAAGCSGTRIAAGTSAAWPGPAESVRSAPVRAAAESLRSAVAGTEPYGARGNDHEGLPGDEPRD